MSVRHPSARSTTSTRMSSDSREGAEKMTAGESVRLDRHEAVWPRSTSLSRGLPVAMSRTAGIRGIPKPCARHRSHTIIPLPTAGRKGFYQLQAFAGITHHAIARQQKIRKKAGSQITAVVTRATCDCLHAHLFKVAGGRTAHAPQRRFCCRSTLSRSRDGCRLNLKAHKRIRIEWGKC